MKKYNSNIKDSYEDLSFSSPFNLQKSPLYIRNEENEELNIKESIKINNNINDNIINNKVNPKSKSKRKRRKKNEIIDR